MFVLVLGTVSSLLKDVVLKNYSLDTFHFVEEINSIKKDYEAQEIIINEKIALSDYQAVILCDLAVVYNYIWHESNDIPWFPSPFDLRNSGNHNFYFSIAKDLRLNVPPSKPIFKDGKVSVFRDFPAGRELSFLILRNEVISLSKYGMSPRLMRTCRTFLKASRVPYGVITFIEDKSGIFFFKEFSPIIDWGDLQESQIMSILDRVLFSAKVVAMGKRRKLG